VQEVLDYLRRTPIEAQTVQLVTPTEVRQAIHQAKISEVPGDDKVSNLVLRNLPARAIVLLTLSFNACLLLGYFPATWKTAKVLAFPKPGKPRHQPGNYRPISLLSCLSKTLERIILTTTLDFITANHISLPRRSLGLLNRRTPPNESTVCWTMSPPASTGEK